MNLQQALALVKSKSNLSKPVYFNDLNYTLSNEDTRIEFELQPENVDSVFSICGSGARVLPLVARHPRHIDIIDLSQEQLYLCELRLAAARALSSEEYLFFLGYRGGLPQGSSVGDDRMDCFSKLTLSEECRTFWLERASHWKPRGFILLGRWENHFQKLGALFRNVLRLDMRPIFEAHSLEEQCRLFNRHWRPRAFNVFLRCTANEYVFNKFLYKGHFSGSSDHRTESRPPWKFIEDEFTRLFTTTLVRKNYFMQVLFLGHIFYEEGLPLEAQPAILEAVKTSKTEARFLQADLLQTLGSRPYDFISLSDTISYLPEDAASRILQSLHPDTEAGSRVVIRSFLRAPGAIDTNGWASLEDKNHWAAQLDGTGVYRFHIFEKILANGFH